ncbi:MAG TPA: FecR domain-containing protein [Gemmatimonadaceae bacterium]|nr:FecR domain-containing protein [Gemmatimonadaceae bacterium]
MSDEQIDWSRLARWLAGESSAAEAAEVRRWLDEDPARAAHVRALGDVWEQAALIPTPDDVSAAWSRTASMLGLPAAPRLVPADPEHAVASAHSERARRSVFAPTTAVPRRRGRIAGYAAAAAVVAAVGIGAALLTHWPPANDARSTVASATTWQEYRTVRGQRAAITLLDGTRVQLGPASRLRVARAASPARTVELEGEAVFDVVHDAAHPFRVVAKDGVLEDIGTTFDVRAYPGDAHTLVAVAAGAVAVRSRVDTSRRAATLGPSDLARVESDGSVSVEHGVDASLFLSWTEGRLAFRHATLREVVEQLERWYDVDIELADSSLARRRLTAIVAAPSLDDALSAVTFPMGLQYTRHERVVRISARP